MFKTSATQPAISIVGIGGVFPHAPTLPQFWKIIETAECTSSFPPAQRWRLPVDDVYHPEEGKLDCVYSKRACFIDNFQLNLPFESLHIDQETALSLDPLFQLLLHAGHQAFTDGNTTMVDPQRIGVIVGNLALPSATASKLAEEYLGKTFAEQAQVNDVNSAAINPLNRFMTGLPAAVLANALGLGGICHTLDAACASSLYAIKLAVDELQAGHVDAMLCGGVARPDSQYTQMGFSQLRALSPTGVCSPFDANGNGLVVGEGAGIVMLKRTADAVRDGDHIYAQIAGIGVSNDIGGSLLAPMSEGQLRAMRAAYKQAGWQVHEVDHIECHATGTPVGDAVEFTSLKELWGNAKVERKCVLGSVKSNIGHLLTAAGSAALLKTLLALKEHKLPPTAGFCKANPNMGMEQSPFEVLSQAKDWDKPAQRPRRAAVSAFGFGGINAHLLLEEWQPQSASHIVAPKPELAAEPIAIIGMDIQLGPWSSLVEFKHQVLGDGPAVPFTAPTNWYGAQTTKWYQNSFSQTKTSGHYLAEVSVTPGQFRIPPTELKEMLPRQALMLKSAATALKDAKLDKADHTHSGVFIGNGLDFNATNFSLRWGLPNKVAEWAQQLNLDVDDQQLEQWQQQLQDAISTPLTANRTMGALGSVVASRIAREFKVGGPSFSIANEENSGIQALHTAIAALQRGEIEHAIVGAVDMPGDIRAQLSQHLLGYTDPIAEGACALILQPLSAAQRAGNKIYAVIDAGTTLCGTKISAPDVSAFKRSIDLACTSAAIDPAVIGYADITSHSNSATAYAQQLHHLCSSDCHINTSTSALGHSGEASGLVGIIQAALALYHCVLPATSANSTELSNRYWLHNRNQGPRRALVCSSSTGGSHAQTVLRQWDDVAAPLPARFPANKITTSLFMVHADSTAQLQQQLEHLKEFCQHHAKLELPKVAALWHEAHPKASAPLSMTFVCDNWAECKEQIEFCQQHLTANPHQRLDGSGGITLPECARDKIFYNPQPLGATGEIALVFPGSGNHFPGMGRDLALHWPAIFEHQHRHNERLKDQYCPQVFWDGVDARQINADHNSMIIAHVALCTALCDTLRSCAIKPQCAIGYSLGESSSLFSLHAWQNRDEMLERIEASTLFTTDLAGPCNAAHKLWQLEETQKVDWCLGIVPVAAEQVRRVIEAYEHAYLLIINTPHECIIGGARSEVERIIQQLACPLIELHGVTTVHCPVPRVVAKAYRDLHLFPTTAPEAIRFYSCASGQSYELNSANCADAILAQATDTIDFTRVINNAYADGVRIFIETGSSNSCSRMIQRILGERPHLVRPTYLDGVCPVSTMAKLLGQLIAEGVTCDPSMLFVELEQQPPAKKIAQAIQLHNGDTRFIMPAAPYQRANSFEVAPQATPPTPTVKVVMEPKPAAPSAADQQESQFANDPFLRSMQATQQQQNAAHGQFLHLSESINQLMERNLLLQQELLAQLPAQPVASAPQATPAPITAPAPRALAATATAPTTATVAFDRQMCMEFAVGSIGKMLGTQFADIDAHPTRVRLPDEPLMLVDRIISVEGEPCSMSHGRVITEHDVTSDRWYLDGGRIPTCVAVEAGQADLFLSGYLGIDKQTKGLAVYRLLDAIVQFHGPLPQPGDIIRYDIRIERFFRQGSTWLFRFNYDCTVNGQPLMTMRNGCAGFFTQAELAAGQGIVHTKFDLMPQPGKRPADWQALVPMVEESYNAEQVHSLRSGDLVSCFGHEFTRLAVANPYTLPSGHMELVDRVTAIMPHGGRFGLGQIRAEMDIKPDDWFITCHFCDDHVMPGTLMYECCLHTLRIYLMRMGWVSAQNEGAWEPVPGVDSQLKCRGQVNEKTNTVTYEVTIKELGYRPEPYAIVDALMYADGKPIVEIIDMSLQISGLNREKMVARWNSDAVASETLAAIGKKPALFDYASILAYSSGKPSEAFGDRYQIFDSARKIARLPRPPFQFLDRITAIQTEQWQMVAGGTIEAQYDVPNDAWYFAAERQSQMPFSVLLEIALQPCGWMAAYVGSALTSDIDLCFRNLDGNAVQLRPVTPSSGTLTTEVKLTKVSSSGGMIIQSYDFCVSDSNGAVYQGDTVFGFFSHQALANQIGIRDAAQYELSSAEQQRAISCAYPQQAPFPEIKLQMIDRIEQFVADGGPHGLGYISASKKVDPSEWFFQAHFYQDPVCPGSLGLESFQQLLKFIAVQRWGATPQSSFAPITLNHKHSWVYRGQIIPSNNMVTVEAIVTRIDDESKTVVANGLLSVDGKIIYQMKDFSLTMRI
ncbi:MAG: beta-ketoacyl synthase N-terminal-like domain-containing protein [Desulfuromonas sp.]|nr:beta-ketoacyl synthase N-terminal-like domain-containing protein [Desulfuromonas sp.]